MQNILTRLGLTAVLAVAFVTSIAAATAFGAGAIYIYFAQRMDPLPSALLAALAMLLMAGLYVLAGQIIGRMQDHKKTSAMYRRQSAIAVAGILGEQLGSLLKSNPRLAIAASALLGGLVSVSPRLQCVLKDIFSADMN